MRSQEGVRPRVVAWYGRTNAETYLQNAKTAEKMGDEESRLFWLRMFDHEVAAAQRMARERKRELDLCAR